MEGLMKRKLLPGLVVSLFGGLVFFTALTEVLIGPYDFFEYADPDEVRCIYKFYLFT